MQETKRSYKSVANAQGYDFKQWTQVSQDAICMRSNVRCGSKTDIPIWHLDVRSGGQSDPTAFS